MKKYYVTPAIKALDIRISSQILSGSNPTPGPNPEKGDQFIPIDIENIEDEGYAD